MGRVRICCHVRLSVHCATTASYIPGQLSVLKSETWVQIQALKIIRYQIPNTIYVPRQVLGSYIYFLSKVDKIKFQGQYYYPFQWTGA